MALAVLVAPVTANAMEQQSAPTSSHHQQTSASAHCDGASDEGSKREKVPGKTCCASMCMGIAVTPTAPAADDMVIHADVTSSPSILYGPFCLTVIFAIAAPLTSGSLEIEQILDFTETHMNKILTAIALSIALPAVAQAQVAPAPAPKATCCEKMDKPCCKDMKSDCCKDMDHSKMDHSKMGHDMKAGTDPHAGHDMSKTAAPGSHQH